MQLNRNKYPFVFIALCLIVGIICGKNLFYFPLSLCLTITFFFFSLFFYKIKRTKVLNIVWVCLLISAGILRYHLAADIFPPHHIITMNINDVSRVEGVITDYQYKKNNNNRYLLTIEKTYQRDTCFDACGKILVYTKKVEKKYNYGDRIRVNVSMEKPGGKSNPGQFDYLNYLQNQNIFYFAQISSPDSIRLLGEKQGFWFIQMFVIPLRSYCQKIFNTYFNDATAALLAALILGEKQELDRQMINNFKNVGVIHVLAISGLHVGFIITFIFSVLSLLRLNYRSKIWALLTVLIIYIIMVRFKTPVIRASCMAILYLIGQSLERKSSNINIIFAAMTIILLIEPREVFNPGFHFSFIAVFSIIYGYDKLDQFLPLNTFIEKYKLRYRWLTIFKKLVWMPCLVSLAAVIGTTPLTLYYYGIFPSYALLANLLVIPLTGIIVFLSLFILTTGVISGIISEGIAMMIQTIHWILQWLVNLISNLPYSSFLTPIPSLGQLTLMYLWIILVLNIRKNKRIVLLLICVVIVSFVISTRSDGQTELQITVLDVGQGDAAFIRFPNQITMLIDGGDRSLTWDQGEMTVLPFLQAMNALHINYLVGSHPHNDHIGGFLTLINSVAIDTLILSGYQYNSKLFASLLSDANYKNVAIKVVGKGDLLIPDPLCRVYILHPDSTHIRSENFHGSECNNSSVVLKIQYGENSVLFTGDLEKSGEQPLLHYESFLESEILKIGHHGSSTSTSDDLLEKVNPLLALISVGEKNKFRHPSPKTLERLKKLGIITYRTSQEGAIRFSIGPDKIRKIKWK